MWSIGTNKYLVKDEKSVNFGMSRDRTIEDKLIYNPNYSICRLKPKPMNLGTSIIYSKISPPFLANSYIVCVCVNIKVHSWYIIMVCPFVMYAYTSMLTYTHSCQLRGYYSNIKLGVGLLWAAFPCFLYS